MWTINAISVGGSKRLDELRRTVYLVLESKKFWALVAILIVLGAIFKSSVLVDIKVYNHIKVP